MEKLTVEKYVEAINAKKWEAHNKDWLYIEVNAKELLEELEPGVKNVNTCSKAIISCLLEGDYFVVEPKSKSKFGNALTVRYYTDNLSPERRTYAEVNK